MNAYEKIVNAMRKSGTYYNQPAPRIGIVGENGTVKMDALTLEKEDYLLNSSLRLEDTPEIYVHQKEAGQSGEYMNAEDHNGSLEKYTDNILKPGDKALVIWIKNEDNDTFVVLAKVVEP